MNLVSLLVAPAIVQFSFGKDANLGLRLGVGLFCVVVIVGAVWVSKRRGIAVGAEAPDGAAPAGEEVSANPAPAVS